MIFALSLATVIVITPPTPVPTTIPEIAHVRSAAACTTLRELSLPIGYVSSRNDQVFTAMNGDVTTFVNGFVNSGGPTVDQLKNGVNPEVPVYVPTGNETLDLFNSKSVLTASDLDQAAQVLFQNLGLEDQLMQESWKKYPQGSDPAVDALRQRAQNLIDLQRALADEYESFAESYLQSNGVPGMVNISPGTSGQSSYVTNLANTFFDEAAWLIQAGNVANSTATPLPALSEVSQFKRIDDAPALASELLSQERVFMPEVAGELKRCTSKTTTP